MLIFRHAVLTSFSEEAFTSENWIVSRHVVFVRERPLTLCVQVRIYEVKKEDLLGRDLKLANAFEQGRKRKKQKAKLLLSLTR